MSNVVDFNTNHVPASDQKRAGAKKTVKHKGMNKILTTIEELNGEFAVLDLYGAPSTYVSRKDYLPITDIDLGRRLANKVVLSGYDQRDQPIYTLAFDAMKGNAGRHSYAETKFTNQQVAPHVFNLYKGIGVVPKAGPIDLIINHVVEILCSGNKTNADNLIKLLAWQIQNIGKASRTMVLFKSKYHQIGKGLFLDFIMEIFGPSSAKPAELKQVIGRFNDQLRGASFIFLDEVVYGGDPKAAAALKTLSTTPEIGIEGKHIPIVKCKIAVNFWLASNEKKAAHIEEADERYWVFDIKEPRRAPSYYTALVDQMRTGGAEAFAHYLLNLDVSNFEPWRDINKNNEAKQVMIMENANPYDVSKWLDECCEFGKVLGMRKEYDPDPEGRSDDRNDPWEDWVEGTVIRNSVLKNAYMTWQKDIRSRVAPEQPGPKEFGSALIRYGLTKKSMDSNAHSGNKLPSLFLLSSLLSSGGVSTQVVDFVKKFGTNGTVEDRRIEDFELCNLQAA